MHGSSSQLNIPPRLRLPRQSASLSTALRNREDRHDNDDNDDDNTSTPRRTPLDIVLDDPTTPAQSNPDFDTPAARLRALLSHSGSPTPKQPRRNSPQPESTEEHNHPFPPSASTSATPSTAHASLKQLFSKALRDHGDTPLKARRRRSSFDSSGLDESPVKAKAKMARKSLSDDEADRSLNKFPDSHLDQSSASSSRAAAYNSLRARLSDPSFGGGSLVDELHDVSLPNASTSPPAATSTPLRQSISQFPIYFSGSNLMGEDSNMQHAINAVHSDSSVDDGGRVQSPGGKTPRAPATSAQDFHVTRHTLSRLSSNDSLDSDHSRTHSRQDSPKPNVHVHDLERGWNRPLSVYMDRHKFGSNDSLSPGHTRGGSLRRQGSSLSLRSADENSLGRSSPSLSAGSTSDHHHSHEKGEPPKPPTGSPSHSRLSSKSPMQLREGNRSRTLSQPTKPSSPFTGRQRADSSTLRERPFSSLGQHRPLSSLGNVHPSSPRTSSPASSAASHDSANDIQHLRERNWNSPHPNWLSTSGHASHAHRRSLDDSPRPQSFHGQSSREASASPTLRRNDTGRLTPSATNARPSRDTTALPESPRRNSVARPTTTPQGSFRGLSASSSLQSRSRSPLPSRRDDQMSSHTHHNSFTRPKSPAVTSESTTRTKKTSLLERQGSNSKPPSPLPSTRINGRNDYKLVSHIPVRSTIPSMVKEAIPIDRFKDHESSYIQAKESSGPKVSISEDAVELRDSDLDSIDNESVDPPHQVSDRLETQQTLRMSQDSSENVESSDQGAPPSPPITPSDVLPSTPKRPGYSSYKLEPKTPSPPRDLPDLPDPPSSDEDSDSTPRTPFTKARDSYLTAKTPRPPGAWVTPFQTPAHSTNPTTVPLGGTTPVAEIQNEMFTPPSSLSRATSLPLRTPAPPGAWMATPAAEKKRALKVRFGENISASQDVDGKDRDDDDNETTPDFSSHAETLTIGQENYGSYIPGTNTNTRSPRRSSGIRVMDAFGNEMPKQGESRRSDSLGSNSDVVEVERSPASKRVTRIRVLDAMGKAIEDSKDNVTHESDNDDDIKSMVRGIEEQNMNNQQAQNFIARTIEQLKSDMHRFPLDVPSDANDARVDELNQRILAASDSRRKIQMKIADTEARLEQSSSLKPNVQRPFAQRLVFTRVFLVLAIVEIIICIAFYRTAQLNAWKMFLTTYIDKFDPALYLHITNPEAFGTLASPIHASDRLAQPTGWSYLAFYAWHKFVDLVLSFENVWHPWSDPSRSVSWPPT